MLAKFRLNNRLIGRANDRLTANPRLHERVIIIELREITLRTCASAREGAHTRAFSPEAGEVSCSSKWICANAFHDNCINYPRVQREEPRSRRRVSLLCFERLIKQIQLNTPRHTLRGLSIVLPRNFTRALTILRLQQHAIRGLSRVPLHAIRPRPRISSGTSELVEFGAIIRYRFLLRSTTAYYMFVYGN